MIEMQKKKTLIGTVKRHPDGFGFFIPDDKEHPDVYIPHQGMRGVMTSDRVEVEVSPEKNSDRFRGEVINIIEHGIKKVVGRFFKLNSSTGVLRDEGKGWGEDLKVKITDSMDAKEKELVVAEITSYPGGNGFTGKVVEIIGDVDAPLNDIKRVLAANSIPVAFSEATLQEAEKFGEVPDEKDFQDRRDLRGMDLITIDGATAKDFDDAVYVETNSTGFLLYVAIADVSHYVQVGSAIDKDAYERGTSVYFPNYVVPMLPEVLSNGLCSLNPHVPRLCLVAEMQFDFSGEMLHSNFFEAVMDSKARVTYGEAQEVIDGLPMPKLDHVREGILRLADLAKILMAKRFRDGSLDLEIPETTMVIDASGIPVDIIKTERLFAHRLIEEMMLAANVATAKFLSKRDVPALYRIHEPPNELAIKLLERYLHNFGGKTNLSDGKLQKRLTKALQEFEGKAESQVLNMLALRSMSQAKYHMDNVGHFGLGFEYYAHFTSPIRRYPDLIVHRLIKSQILKNSRYQTMDEGALLTAGTMLSATEQRSVKAERAVQAIKKARFMEKFVGEELDGIISSVAKFGVFVSLRDYDVDGLVRLDDLGGEKWEFDEDNLRLVGKRSGFAYTIGDPMRILVSAVDTELGQVNFTLAEGDEKTPAQNKAEKFVKKLRGENPPPAHEGRGQQNKGSRETQHDEPRRQTRGRSRNASSEGKRENREREAAAASSGRGDRDRDRKRNKQGSKKKKAFTLPGNKMKNPGRGTAPGGRDFVKDPPAKRTAFGSVKNAFTSVRNAFSGGSAEEKDTKRREDLRSSDRSAKMQSQERDPQSGRQGRNQENTRQGRDQQGHRREREHQSRGEDRRQGDRRKKEVGGKAGRGFATLKPDFSTNRPPEDSGPNKDLLKMIMGPAASKAIEEIEKPKLSRKLQASENTRLEPREKESVTSQSGNPARKDPQERGSAANDRGGVRKARVSQRRGKGKAR